MNMKLIADQESVPGSKETLVKDVVQSATVEQTK